MTSGDICSISPDKLFVNNYSKAVLLEAGEGSVMNYPHCILSGESERRKCLVTRTLFLLDSQMKQNIKNSFIFWAP